MALAAKKTSSSNPALDALLQKATESRQGHIHCTAPEELLTKLKVHAAQNGLKIRDVVITAITEYLDKQRKS